MNCSWITPNLVLGSSPSFDKDFQKLKSLNVTAVLSLQTDEDRGDGGIEGERIAANKGGLVFASIPIEDFNAAELRSCLPAGVAALERLLGQGHTVYVHCTAGVNRSPTVVAAYFHWCLGSNSYKYSFSCMRVEVACRTRVPYTTPVVRIFRSKPPRVRELWIAFR